MVLPFSNESETTTAWIVQDHRKLKFIATFTEFEGFGCVITEPKF